MGLHGHGFIYLSNLNNLKNELKENQTDLQTVQCCDMKEFIML